MAEAAKRGGVILRSLLVLALAAVAGVVWVYFRNIQAEAQVNLALRAAFAGRVTGADPDAMIIGQPDMVSRDSWMGCADFAPASYVGLSTATLENPPPADDLGWQSPVDLSLYVERGLFNRLTLVQASVAVLGSDLALADVIDPDTGALLPAAVADIRTAGYGAAYDRLLAGLHFAPVQQLGCPGFTVFQVEGK
jgi:hypothetical protein